MFQINNTTEIGQSDDIMSWLSGLDVCVHVNDFSSKTTKCRDMFFFKKKITYLSTTKNCLRHADLCIHPP